MPGAELRPISVEELDRLRVALVSRAARAGARRRAGPNASRGELVGRLAGDVRLEVAVARRSPAGDAVVDDHHVAELGAGADRAAVGPAAEDQPAADPGAEREHDHVGRAATGADAPLGDRGGVRVVVDRRPAGRAARRITSRNGDVDERDVHRADRVARRWSIRDGIPKPTATTLSSSSSRDRAPRAPSSSASSDSTGVGYSRCARRSSRRADDAGEDLRPADVDADHVGAPRAAATLTPPLRPSGAQTELLRGPLGLPFTAGCRRRRSPTASTGAGASRGRSRPAKPERGRAAAARAAVSTCRPSRRWLRRIPVALGARSCLLVARLGARELLPVPRRRLRREQAARAGAPSRRSTTQHGERRRDILLLGTDHAQLDGPRVREPHRTRSRSSASTPSSTGSPTSRSRATSSSTIPGHGDSKINAAMQLGGPALAVETVSAAPACRSTTSSSSTSASSRS